MDGAEFVGAWVGCGWWIALVACPYLRQDGLRCWWVIREALYVDPSEAAVALVEVWVARVPFSGGIRSMVGRVLLVLRLFRWRIGVV